MGEWRRGRPLSLKISDSCLSSAGGAVCWLAGDRQHKPGTRKGLRGCECRDHDCILHAAVIASTMCWDQRLQRCPEACLAVPSPGSFSTACHPGSPFEACQNRNCRDGAGSGRPPARSFHPRNRSRSGEGRHAPRLAFLLRRGFVPKPVCGCSEDPSKPPT